MSLLGPGFHFLIYPSSTRAPLLLLAFPTTTPISRRRDILHPMDVVLILRGQIPIHPRPSLFFTLVSHPNDMLRLTATYMCTYVTLLCLFEL